MLGVMANLYILVLGEPKKLVAVFKLSVENCYFLQLPQILHFVHLPECFQVVSAVECPILFVNSCTSRRGKILFDGFYLFLLTRDPGKYLACLGYFNKRWEVKKGIFFYLLSRFKIFSVTFALFFFFETIT